MIDRIVLPVLETNCYLIGCASTGKAILVDPGSGAEMISVWLKEKNQDVELIVLTHGHFDHIGAVEDLRRELGVKVAIHKDDAPMLIEPALSFAGLSGGRSRISPADILLEDNQELRIGDMVVKVIHTPGHTPGGVCLLTQDGLISGDTLFDRSIGRTDLPGGSSRLLLNSIREKLLVLDEHLPVFPGHGDATTIGREKRKNPYLNGTWNG